MARPLAPIAHFEEEGDVSVGTSNVSEGPRGPHVDKEDNAGSVVCSQSSGTGSSVIPPGPEHLQIDYMSIVNDLRDGLPYKQLNIMVLGSEGCGKSSLINSMLMAINPGGYRNVASEIDKCFLTSYSILDESKGDTSKFLCRPRLFECPGLPNQNDENCVTLLKMLLFGHLKEDRNINEMLERKMPKEKIKLDNNRRADVVIFVQSAAEEVPEYLIENFNKAVNFFRQNVGELVTIGVISQIDEIAATSKTEQEILCKNFAEKIGIKGVEENIFYTTLYQIDNSSQYQSADQPNGLRLREIDRAMCQLWANILRTKPDYPRKERSGIFSRIRKHLTL